GLLRGRGAGRLERPTGGTTRAIGRARRIRGLAVLAEVPWILFGHLGLLRWREGRRQTAASIGARRGSPADVVTGPRPARSTGPAAGVARSPYGGVVSTGAA